MLKFHCSVKKRSYIYHEIMYPLKNISYCLTIFPLLIFYSFLVFRFKRFDNKFIRPYLVRNHYGAEPKILETYSKLAMKDAMDYIRRNASTIGNISGTESMSAIFRNYSNTGQFNGRYGCCCCFSFYSWFVSSFFRCSPIRGALNYLART